VKITQIGNFILSLDHNRAMLNIIITVASLQRSDEGVGRYIVTS